MTDRFSPFAERMRRAGLSEAHLAAFRSHFTQFEQGATGFLTRADIVPVTEVPSSEDLPRPSAGRARELLDRTLVLKLNGGLGTSMGLSGPKSLLPVRNGRSFLDFCLAQLAALREAHGSHTPLVLMNSFHTREETLQALKGYPPQSGPLPPEMVQSQVPKIDAQTLAPAAYPQDPELEWCPPGHGDLYPTLWGSGMLAACLEHGFEYAFVSNIDNLGATVDPSILAWFAECEHTLLMEVARRTAEDRKGGHLARRRRDGALLLREVAQCPPDELAEFQDYHAYSFFNTNTLWLRLSRLRDVLQSSQGFLPLPLIVNRKTVNPQEPGSAPVIQLETAMGAAISQLGGQAALVPRSRFLPVKNTDDLTLIASDLYEDRPDGSLSRRTTGPLPSLRLDPRYFRMHPDWTRHFPEGVPSLCQATSLRIEGEVFFGRDVRIVGEVELKPPDSTAQSVPNGAVLGSPARAPS